MRDRALDPGDLEEVLLGLLDALGDRGGHLLGLAVSNADHPVAVADDDQRGEAEAPATLDDLGYPVDRDYSLYECGLLRRGVPTPVTTTLPPLAAGAGTAALGSSHIYVLFLRFVVVRTRGRPRGHPRPVRRPGRGSGCRHGRTPRSRFRQPSHARRRACPPPWPWPSCRR